jgi:hypothetical protein
MFAFSFHFCKFSPTSIISSSIFPEIFKFMSIEPVLLFYGDYSGNEEPSVWFAQFQLSLPTAWTDTQCVQCFTMQLMPGQMADQWFQSLHSMHTTTFAVLKIAFLKWWLPPKLPKLSYTQQREHVAVHVLKRSDIGVLMPDGNFAHVMWATKVSQLALGMGDFKGDLIEDALEGIPNLLKDHLTGMYSIWDQFIKDVWQCRDSYFYGHVMGIFIQAVCLSFA